MEPYGGEIRVGDAERERVAEALRRAVEAGRLSPDEGADRLQAAYAAKTRAHLAALTSDLPERPVGLAPVPARPSAVVAVVGSAERRGSWVVPERLRAVAVMGSVELDLTEAALARREVTIEALAFLGSVELRVPAGVRVIVDVVPVLGSRECKVAGPVEPDSLTIWVRGLAILGSVEVKSPKNKKRWRRRQ